MSKGAVIAFIAVAACLTLGCCSSGGSYVNPDEQRVSDAYFSDTDLNMIADAIVKDFLESPLMSEMEKKPRLTISRVINDTAEHIDTTSLANKIKTQMIRSNRVTYIAVDLRTATALEKAYQSGDMVKGDLKAQFGNETPPEFLFYGNIAAIYKTENRTKITYYKFTMQLVNIETSEVSWIQEKEIKKEYTKAGIRW